MSRKPVVAMSALRVQGGQERAGMRPFPPLAEDHPSVGRACGVCGCSHAAGDVVTIIPLGPGADEEHQSRARAGRWYTCLGVIAHALCAGLDVERTGSPTSGDDHA